MKKTLLLSFAFVAALLGTAVLIKYDAFAVSGNCYFGSGQCTTGSSFTCGPDDVLPGRSADCNSGRALGNVADAANTKSVFIDTIISKHNDGDNRVNKGAQFIMQETTGTSNNSDFRRLLEQEDVTITIETRDLGNSSFRDASKNDFFYANYSSSNRRVIVIRQDNAVKSMIEVACGNMTGNPVRVTQEKWKMHATSTVNKATALPGEGVQWTHQVWNDDPGQTDKSDTVSGDVYWANGTSGPIPDKWRNGTGLPVEVQPDKSYSKRFAPGQGDGVTRGFNNDPNFTIPDNAKDGDRYCQYINVSETDWSNHANFHSDPACVTVNIPNTPPTGKITVTCVDRSSGLQRITYDYSRPNYGDPDQTSSTKPKGKIGTSAANPENIRSAAETPTSDTIDVTDSAGNVTYTLRVENIKPDGTRGDYVAVDSATSGGCSQGPDQPPTGFIKVDADCSLSKTDHRITYWGMSDPNGSTDGKVTTSSASSSSNVVSGPSTGSTIFWKPHGVVTYYLWVKNIDQNGNSTGYGSSPIASATSTNPLPCPSSVDIDPDATLMNQAGTAPLAGTTVAPGTQISTRTRVYNNGDTATSSQWIREFWYDDNNNSAYDSGEARVVPTASGGPTTYNPLVYTSVAGTANGTVDGTKQWICVALRLTNVATTPATTVTPPNPDVDCKRITTVGNSLTPSVGISPSIIEPGQTVTATAVVNCGLNTAASSNYRRIMWFENGGNPSRYDDPSDQLVSGRDISSFGTYCTFNPFTDWPTVVPSSGVTRVCTSLQLMNPVNPIGTTIPSPPNDINAACADVATKYFFEVTNGDINAAACLISCATTPSISAFNGGSGTSYRGAGSQIAAFSTGSITEFTSSNSPSVFTTSPTNPKRLTFANSGAGYGGNFTQRYQIPDYWSGPISGSDNVIDGSDPLIVHRPGDVRITGSRTVGSVGIGNVPNLQWVIADGNIYIDKSVTQLNGIYIAKGNIYTCSNNFTPVSLGPTMAAQCTNALTIRGALIAGNSVKLQRVTGGLGSGGPAEVIEYNPFVWMQGINTTTPLPTSTSGTLDFITTLPPIL